MMSHSDSANCQTDAAKTPLSINNRAGLSEMRYRIGTHASMLRTMIARLSSGRSKQASAVLETLTAREPDDASIALLDAWATIGDLLTFYQERIANENFLTTARHRESVEYLARMVGFKPRPGLAASVFLAFDVDDQSSEVLIPAGTPAKSTPAPGSTQSPQGFETSGDFVARPQWNLIRPRQVRPQHLTDAGVNELERLYFQGGGLRVQADDFLAIQTVNSDSLVKLKRVSKVEEIERDLDGVKSRVTVAYLATDPHSAKVLIDEIEQLSKTAANGLTSLFSTEYLNNAILQPIAEVRNRAQSLRLIGADERLQQTLVLDALLGPKFKEDVKSRFIKWFEDRKTDKLYAFDNVTYASLRTAYVSAHQRATAALRPFKDLKPKLAALDLTKSGQFANAVVDVQKEIWSDEMRRGDLRPSMYFGGNAAINSPAIPADPMAPDPSVAPCPTPRIQLNGVFTGYKHIHVNVDVTDGVKLKVGTKPTPRTLATAGAVQQGFEDDVKKILAISPKYGYLRFRFRASKEAVLPTAAMADEAKWEIIGYGIQPFGANHSPPFGALPHSRIVVAEQDASGKIQVAPEFSFGESTFPNVKLTARISPSMTAFFPEEPGAPAALATKLAAAQVNFPGDKSPAHVQIEVKDAAGKRVAFAYHMVIPVQTISPPPSINLTRLRRELASGLASFHRPIATKDSIVTSVTNQTNLEAKLAAVSTNEKCSVIIADSADKLKRTDRRAAELGLIQADSTLMGVNAVGPSPASGLRGLWIVLRNKAKELKSLGDGDSPYIDAKVSSVNPETAGSPFAVATLSSAAALDAAIDLMQAPLHLSGSANPYLAFNAIGGSRDSLARAVLKKLYDNRKSLVDILKEKVGAETLPEPVNSLLSEPFAVTGARSLALRLKALEGVIDKTTALEPADLKNKGLTLRDFTVLLQGDKSPTPVKGIITDLELAAEPLPPAQRKLVLDIVANWRNELRNRGAGITSANTSSTGDLQQTLLQGADNIQIDKLNPRQLNQLFEKNSDLVQQVLTALKPQDRDVLLDKVRRSRVDGPIEPRVWAFRRQGNLFGWNAPTSAAAIIKKVGTETHTLPPGEQPPPVAAQDKVKDRIFIDGEFKNTLSDSVVAIQRPVKASEEAEEKNGPIGYMTVSTESFARTDYGLSNVATQVDFKKPAEPNKSWELGDDFEDVRSTRVWCDAEQLPLADESLTDRADSRVLRDGVNEIELDDFYPFLTTQSSILIEGVAHEDDNLVGQVYQRELTSIVGLKHAYYRVKNETSPDGELIYGDQRRTTISLKNPLSRSYFRKTVRIYANVVEATHGETLREVLGSGDGGSPHQALRLQSAPLTRLPAANAQGAEDQLEVRVNNVVWPQAPRLAGLSTDVEAYETSQLSSGQVALRFGDGRRGARLPSGTENVRSQYRVGLGAPGNVEADRIDQLPSPPLGVNSVRNPIRSAGGADADTAQQTRIRAGGWSSVLDRLLSVSDYRNFALAFAGVDKVHAVQIQGVIVLTVAGAASEPLPASGALLRNLRKAIENIGDPETQFAILSHRALLIFLRANVKVDPNYEWDDVESRVRLELFARFSYRNRDLNQDVLRAELIACIQSVAGVVYVDVDNLMALGEFVPKDDKNISNLSRISLPLKRPQPIAGEAEQPAPAANKSKQQAAEICFLDPNAPDTLILEQVR